LDGDRVRLTMQHAPDSVGLVFDHPSVARESQPYAKIIAQARTRSQKARVTVQENNFTGRGPLEPGNLALVQLLARVPWVYNETGAKTAGNPRAAMSISSEQHCAGGPLVGIERAVPLAARAVEQPSAGAATLRSCLVQQVEPRSRSLHAAEGLPAVSVRVGLAPHGGAGRACQCSLIPRARSTRCLVRPETAPPAASAGWPHWLH
jgi:hypothetical protein